MAINLASSLKGCRSWDDLQKRWKDCDKKTKGDLFEALVKNYLLLTPEFASKFKAVWGFKEIPSSVFQKLKLPSSDKGIDLVAETKEGDYWAIQCKYREDSSDQITWREISTFMGLYLGRKQISFGLIASTTERITKVLKDHDRVGFLAYDIWQGIDEEFFKRLQARLHKKKRPLKARLPRPHQKEAIRDAVAYFKKRGNSRGKLIMPCGTGKSLTSFFIAEKLKAQRVLIAVPSLSLIRQTLKEWMRESLARNHKVEWICVCSDESAGKIDQDDAVVLTQDLGVPCLTDSKQIANWLKRKHKSRTIIFTTYQSGQALAKAARNAAFAFDLGIMDEAHKTAGAKDRLFSHLILDKNIKIARRIFMTATERRYRGESDEILSMEDPDDYGETIHKLSFKKALEYKPAILSDYKVVTIHTSQEEIAELVRNRAFVRPKTKKWSKEMGAENLAALIALRKAMKKYPIRHAVSFHGSIRKAQEFKERNDTFSKCFPSGREIQTFHVSGRTPTGARARELNQFSEAPKGLITNARCLTEGVDVPNIDAVLFADPRKSLVDIVQSVGRALRPSPKKKFGYVILPLLHRKNAKFNEIFESDSFKEVLTTLRALGSQDERIIEYFRIISNGRRTPNNRSFDSLLTPKLAKKVDINEFTKAVELRCWDRLACLAWRPFKDARKYVRSLKIKSNQEYKEACKSDKRLGFKLPLDIPRKPEVVYKKSGWISWQDWLGNKFREWRSFEEARSFARSLKINSTGWVKYCSEGLKGKPQKPVDIPALPQRVYAKTGWKGYADWLGTKNADRKEFLKFEKARAYVRKLKFRTALEWREGSRKLPSFIPRTPDRIYRKKGWIDTGDWIGTGNKSTRGRKYWPFLKSRKYVRSLKLNSFGEYIRYAKGQILKNKPFPHLLPKDPRSVYKNRGWKNTVDWLGTKTIPSNLKKFWPFKKARAYARKLKLKSTTEWRLLLKGKLKGKKLLHKNIPAKPDLVYKDKGWNGYGDWLDSGYRRLSRNDYLSYKQAKLVVKKKKIVSIADWRKRYKDEFGKNYKKGTLIPARPDYFYKQHGGWKNWGEFLGTGTIAAGKIRYRSFLSARRFARSLKLSGQAAWFEVSSANNRENGKFPRDIPTAANTVYCNKGWRGWWDFLGTGVPSKKYLEWRSFKAAREFARTLNLKNQKEWFIVSSRENKKNGKFPLDIPKNVRSIYKKVGWAGWKDFLGN